MSALKTLRATSGWGELAWVVVLSAIGALTGWLNGDFSHSMAQGMLIMDEATASSLFAAHTAIFLLLLRYQVGSGTSLLFWFDAARQGVPGITGASLRAEALRLVLLFAALFVPLAAVAMTMAGFDGLRGLPRNFAMALAAVGIGALCAVLPRRRIFSILMVSWGFFLAIWAGWMPRDPVFALLLGLAVFLGCAVLVALRLKALLVQSGDSIVGGDGPLALWVFGVADAAAGSPATDSTDSRPSRLLAALDEDGRVRALLGEMPRQASVAPIRHTMLWLGEFFGYPALMLGFFAVMNGFDGVSFTFEGIARLSFLLLLLVAFWGSVMIVPSHASYYGSVLRDPRSSPDIVPELSLIPGVVATPARWHRRLRRLWLPASIAFTTALLMCALLAGVGPWGLLHLAVAGGLLALLLRFSIHADLYRERVARRFVLAGQIAFGLYMLLGVPLWMTGPLDGFVGSYAAWLSGHGLAPGSLAWLSVAPVLVLMALVVLRLRGVGETGLVRPSDPRAPATR